MSVKYELIGKKFGRLTVIASLPPSSRGRWWLCRCDCGNEYSVTSHPLVHGRTQSCGCIRSERMATLTLSHGMSSSPEWMAWHTMRDRCNNPNSHAYADYGGRGIRVCPEWEASFESFYADMGPRPGPEYSLDRRENHLGYSKNNCRWATKSVQQLNQRPSTRNQLGVRGVSPTIDGKYLAQMVVKGKVVLNKTCDNLDEAISARKAAERTHLGMELTHHNDIIDER